MVFGEKLSRVCSMYIVHDVYDEPTFRRECSSPPSGHYRSKELCKNQDSFENMAYRENLPLLNCKLLCS